MVVEKGDGFVQLYIRRWCRLRFTLRQCFLNLQREPTFSPWVRVLTERSSYYGLSPPHHVFSNSRLQYAISVHVQRAFAKVISVYLCLVEQFVGAKYSCNIKPSVMLLFSRCPSIVQSP